LLQSNLTLHTKKGKWIELSKGKIGTELFKRLTHWKSATYISKSKMVTILDGISRFDGNSKYKFIVKRENLH
jgi:hypothetical protein